MKRRQRGPIMPPKLHDPAGLDALERRAMADFARRYKAIGREVLKYLQGRLATNARQYFYDLRPETVTAIFADINNTVSEMLLGEDDGAWFFEGYVRPAYVAGTSKTFANLARQSPTYVAGRVSIRSLMQTERYRSRLALLGAREFEEMKGLEGSAKSTLARVLTDGLARGKNPRTIAATIRDELGMEYRRAERIARTEIMTAQRRARLDEAEDAAEDYNLVTKQMHLSALSPTTRRSHAERHGNLYTPEQVRDWYSEDGNAINCKCSQVEVMVDDNGNPLVPAIVARAKAARANYEREQQNADAS